MASGKGWLLGEGKVAEILLKMLEELKSINHKLDSIIEFQVEPKNLLAEENKQSITLQADALTLLNLPGSMRVTAMALLRFEGAVTARDLSEATGKLRTTESHIANQLVRQGLAKKKRLGRQVYFSIEPNMENKS